MARFVRTAPRRTNPRPSISLAPLHRLTDRFVFVGPGDMPQKPLANFLVNEHGECAALRMPPSVQFHRKMALIDASLKRRRVPHFRKHLSTKAEKPLGAVLVISRMNFSKAWP